MSDVFVAIQTKGALVTPLSGKSVIRSRAGWKMISEEALSIRAALQRCR
jgi:hypothetical protein